MKYDFTCTECETCGCPICIRNRRINRLELVAAPAKEMLLEFIDLSGEVAHIFAEYPCLHRLTIALREVELVGSPDV